MGLAAESDSNLQEPIDPRIDRDTIHFAITAENDNVGATKKPISFLLLYWRASVLRQSVGAWQVDDPVHRSGNLYIRRLCADGAYEYRLATPEEQFAFLNRIAW